MRIKYSLINKLNTLKSTEFTLFLYLAKYQQLNGLVQGVHNQTVCFYPPTDPDAEALTARVLGRGEHGTVIFK